MGVQVQQGLQYEVPVCQFGVGHGQPLIGQLLVAIQQQVKVQRARPPVLQPFTAVCLFDGLQLVQQLVVTLVQQTLKLSLTLY